MAKELGSSPHLEELAKSIIEEYQNQLLLGNAKIEYVLVHPEISKTVAGRCIRANTELKYFSGADYVIEMSAKLWNALDDNLKKILMLHELFHIHCVMNDKGDWKYGMRDHDVKDFSFIIKQFGTNWLSPIKAIAASIYDVAEVELGDLQV